MPTQTGGGGSATTQPASASFAQYIATNTGLDVRTLVAWIVQEGAYAPGGTGGYNFLNLRPAAGDVGVASVSSGGFDRFKDLASAETSTLNRLHNPFAGAILASGGQSPRQEIAAIASTGWDAAHYGGPGGPNLAGAFERLYPGQLDAPNTSITPSTPGASGNVGTHVTTFPALPGGDAVASAAGSVASAVGDVAGIPGSIVGVLKWPFEHNRILRFGEIVLGLVIAILGVLMLTRGLTLPVAAAAVARKVPT